MDRSAHPTDLVTRDHRRGNAEPSRALRPPSPSNRERQSLQSVSPLGRNATMDESSPPPDGSRTRLPVSCTKSGGTTANGPTRRPAVSSQTTVEPRPLSRPFMPPETLRCDVNPSHRLTQTQCSSSPKRRLFRAKAGTVTKQANRPHQVRRQAGSPGSLRNKRMKFAHDASFSHTGTDYRAFTSRRRKSDSADRRSAH